MAVYTVLTKIRMMYAGYFLAEKALHIGWHIENFTKRGKKQAILKDHEIPIKCYLYAGVFFLSGQFVPHGNAHLR